MKKSKCNIWLVILCLCFLPSIFAGCRKVSGPLSSSSFAVLVEHNKYRVTDGAGSAAGMTVWKNAHDSNGSTVQYIEFGDEASALDFYTVQQEQIESQTGKTSSSNPLMLTADGFYYYLARYGNKVVLATGKTENRADIDTLMQEIARLARE